MAYEQEASAFGRRGARPAANPTKVEKPAMKPKMKAKAKKKDIHKLIFHKTATGHMAQHVHGGAEKDAFHPLDHEEGDVTSLVDHIHEHMGAPNAGEEEAESKGMDAAEGKGGEAAEEA